MDGAREEAEAGAWASAVPEELPAAASPAGRGAALGALTGLVSMAPCVPYVLELDAAGVPLHLLVPGFAALVLGTGAALGAALVLAMGAADRASGARAWAVVPALAVAGALVAAGPGALGTWFFGSLTLPYLGNGAVFAIPVGLGLGLAIATAWLDAPGPRARSLGLSAAIAIALFAPIGAAFALLVTTVPDDDALDAFRTVPLAPLGAALAGGLGAIFGAVAGAVVALRRAIAR